MGNNDQHAFKFDCLHCGQTISAGDEVAGRVVECPSCAQAFQAPQIASPSRSASGRPRSRRKTGTGGSSWAWPVVGGIVAVAALALMFVSVGVFDKSNLEKGDLEKADRATSVSDQKSGPIRSGGALPKYSQVAEPLAKFKENRYWQEFLKGERRKIHFVDDAPEWTDIDGSVVRRLHEDTLSPELLAFHQGLHFCQTVRGGSDDVQAEKWSEWLAHLGIEDLDEFERRDLISSEKAAYEDILTALPDESKYTVIIDQVFKLGEFDFDESAFHLSHSYSYPEDEGGHQMDNPYPPVVTEDLFVSEGNARALRKEGVTHVCIREEIIMEWNVGWWLVGKDAAQSLVEVEDERFISSSKWEFHNGSLRRKGGSPDEITQDFSESFLTALEEFHGLYAEHVTPFYSIFSVVEGIQKGDVHDFNQEILKMHQMRNAYAVGFHRFEVEKKLRKQLDLLELSEEQRKLILSYIGAAGTGFHFVGANTPQASLEALPKFLDVHKGVYTKHEEILKMLGDPKAAGEGG